MAFKLKGYNYPGKSPLEHDGDHGYLGSGKHLKDHMAAYDHSEKENKEENKKKENKNELKTSKIVNMKDEPVKGGGVSGGFGDLANMLKKVITLDLGKGSKSNPR
mgnify:CR=1 FL=1